MKTFLVKFTCEVWEEIEADDEEAAKQAFSERWSSAEEMVQEMGITTAECLTVE